MNKEEMCKMYVRLTAWGIAVPKCTLLQFYGF